MRELKWCHDLGQVQLELEVNDQVLNFQVSPSSKNNTVNNFFYVQSSSFISIACNCT